MIYRSTDLLIPILKDTIVKNYLRTNAKYIFTNGIVAGLLISLLGAFLGMVARKLFSPGGWGGLLYTLRGAVWGYGIGVSLGTFKAHRKYDGKRSLSRAFYSSITALLAVVFLAEPFHLQTFPPLMLGALIFFPPFVATIFMYEHGND